MAHWWGTGQSFPQFSEPQQDRGPFHSGLWRVNMQAAICTTCSRPQCTLWTVKTFRLVIVEMLNQYKKILTLSLDTDFIHRSHTHTLFFFFGRNTFPLDLLCLWDASPPWQGAWVQQMAVCSGGRRVAMSAVGQWAGTYSSAVQDAAAKPTAGTATCVTCMTKPVRLTAQTVQS